MMFSILSIAYPFAVVGPSSVGGAEQILTVLEGEMVSRGHRSIVVARDGSLPSGRLLPTMVPPGVITAEVRDAVTRRHQANIDLALASEAVDLVHMHGIDFHLYRIPADIPVLVTLHLPPSWYPEDIWRLPPNFRLQCVSETQRLACPVEVRDRLPVVGNGVLLPPADKLPSRRNYALLLSRICPEKNLHSGIEAARLAGVPVILAGEAFPYEEHLRYLREEIQPRVGDRVRLLGPVEGAGKTRLLARARCLLLPTLALETSSLVAMEAMAVGTPVVAYASGAIPDIVQHGRTGFLVKNIAEMATAIQRVKEIDPADCRALAASLFPLSRMVESYAALYREMTASHREPATPRDATPSASFSSTDSDSTQTHSDDSLDKIDESDVVRISVVTTTRELEALRPEWRTLWQSDPVATPFQSPEWLIPWWKHVGEGELFTLAIRDRHDSLIGLVPLYIYTQPADEERHLLLLGAGTSDYLDGLFSGQGTVRAERIAEAALHYLSHCQGRWDRVILHQLRENSSLVTCRRGTSWRILSAESCSSLPVAGWQLLPAKIRANSRRCRRRAEARGRLSFITAANSRQALEGLEHLISFHDRRWQETGVLRSTSVQQHHRESVPELLNAGLLWMLSLEIDNHVVAVLYTLLDSPKLPRSGRRLYSYLIGFDLDFSDLSPGTLLLSFAFDRCEAHQIERLDMLRGGEEYKQLWGATPEPIVALTLASDLQAP